MQSTRLNHRRRKHESGYNLDIIYEAVLGVSVSIRTMEETYFEQHKLTEVPSIKKQEQTPL